MGAHTSFPMLIEHLVGLKSHFHNITVEQYQGVIKELSNYDVQFYSDNDHLPTADQLAVKMKCDLAS